MKTLVLNGSPRSGNTTAACTAFMSGLKYLNCEMINLNNCSIHPCQACDVCGCESDCVYDDDTNEIIDKMIEADFILFASPVYWWGVSSQMKLAIDKMYSKGNIFKEKPKKVGVIAIGEDSLDGPQYDLIKTQFECISEYLGWDMRFFMPISAQGLHDLEEDKSTMACIEMLHMEI